MDEIIVHHTKLNRHLELKMQVANDSFFADFESVTTETISAYMRATLDLDVSGHSVMSLEEAVDAVFDRIRGAMCDTPFFEAAMAHFEWEGNTRRAIQSRLLSDYADYDNEREFYAIELAGETYVAVPDSYITR